MLSRTLRIDRNKHLLVLAFLIVASLVRNTVPARASYNCGDNANNHCYSGAYWQFTNHPQAVQAVYTTFNVTHLLASGSYPSFIDDEIWFKDYLNSSCSGGTCWVEGGEKSDQSMFGGHPVWFYADMRPGIGYQNHNNVWTQIYYPDNQGNIEIQAYGAPPNQYRVTIWDDHGTAFDQYSTSNSMLANGLQVGIELAGNQTASAPTTTYNYTEYFNSGYWAYASSSPTWTRFNNFPPTGTFQGNGTGNVLTTWCPC